MKITQEVREFARLNPTPFVPSEVEGRTSPLPEAGEGDSPAASQERAVETPLDPEAAMAEMSKRFHEEGGELYMPARD